VQLELALVGHRQLAERVLVARTCASKGLLGHARVLSSPVPLTRITTNDANGPRNSPRNLARVDRLNSRPDQRSTTMGKIVMSGPQNMSLDGVV
jgi:hypothetical protein